MQKAGQAGAVNCLEENEIWKLYLEQRAENTEFNRQYSGSRELERRGNLQREQTAATVRRFLKAWKKEDLGGNDCEHSIRKSSPEIL